MLYLGCFESISPFNLTSKAQAKETPLHFGGDLNNFTLVNVVLCDWAFTKL